MENIDVLVTLELEKRVSVQLMPYQLQDVELKDIIAKLTDEECRELLISGCRGFSADLFTVEGIVKKVIDEFDPYAFMPRFDGPYDEYDLESNCIAGKIEYGMSVDEIAEIVEDVFVFYFNAKFPSEIYWDPALLIHIYLDKLYNDMDEKKEEEF